MSRKIPNKRAVQYACWALSKIGLNARLIEEMCKTGIHYSTVARYAKEGDQHIDDFMGEKREIREVVVDPVVMDQVYDDDGDDGVGVRDY